MQLLIITLSIAMVTLSTIMIISSLQKPKKHQRFVKTHFKPQTEKYIAPAIGGGKVASVGPRGNTYTSSGREIIGHADLMCTNGNECNPYMTYEECNANLQRCANISATSSRFMKLQECLKNFGSTKPTSVMGDDWLICRDES